MRIISIPEKNAVQLTKVVYSQAGTLIDLSKATDVVLTITDQLDKPIVGYTTEVKDGKVYIHLSDSISLGVYNVITRFKWNGEQKTDEVKPAFAIIRGGVMPEGNLEIGGIAIATTDEELDALKVELRDVIDEYNVAVREHEDAKEHLIEVADDIENVATKDDLTPLAKESSLSSNTQLTASISQAIGSSSSTSGTTLFGRIASLFTNVDEVRNKIGKADDDLTKETLFSKIGTSLIRIQSVFDFLVDTSEDDTTLSGKLSALVETIKEKISLLINEKIGDEEDLPSDDTVYGEIGHDQNDETIHQKLGNTFDTKENNSIFGRLANIAEKIGSGIVIPDDIARKGDIPSIEECGDAEVQSWFPEFTGNYDAGVLNNGTYADGVLTLDATYVNGELNLNK